MLVACVLGFVFIVPALRVYNIDYCQPKSQKSLLPCLDIPELKKFHKINSASRELLLEKEHFSGYLVLILIKKHLQNHSFWALGRLVRKQIFRSCESWVGGYFSLYFIIYFLTLPDGKNHLYDILLLLYITFSLD